MTAFDTAWAIAKADTGMWDEIYAPLHQQLSGRGSAPPPDKGRPVLDFIPTSLGMEMLNQHIKDAFRSNIGGDSQDYQDKYDEWVANSKGDHGFDIDSLKQSILEEGYKIPDKIFNSRSQYIIPSFEFDIGGGMEQYEGRHRTKALSELGAPYMPSFGMGTHMGLGGLDRLGIQSPYSVNPIYLSKPDYYSPAAYYGPERGRYPVPPSYAFGREIVPGMGRLIPSWKGKAISDKDMLAHISDSEMGDEWVDRPEWKVIYD